MITEQEAKREAVKLVTGLEEYEQGLLKGDRLQKKIEEIASSLYYFQKLVSRLFERYLIFDCVFCNPVCGELSSLSTLVFEIEVLSSFVEWLCFW